MQDSHGTLLTFAEDATMTVEEQDVTPGNVAGGAPIDATSHRNTSARTKWPTVLLERGPLTSKVKFKTADIPKLEAMLLTNQLITTTWPDGATQAQWGWLQSITYTSATSGVEVTADLEIIISNLNATDVETDVAYAPAP